MVLLFENKKQITGNFKGKTQIPSITSPISVAGFLQV